MGSYGIGISRLVAATIEANFINNVMKWPKSISHMMLSSFQALKNNTDNLKKAEEIYKVLKKQILTHC